MYEATLANSLGQIIFFNSYTHNMKVHSTVDRPLVLQDACVQAICVYIAGVSHKRSVHY